MSKLTTKYFGEIVLDETSDWADVDVEFNGQEINIALTDTKLHGDKLKNVWNLLTNMLK